MSSTGRQRGVSGPASAPPSFYFRVPTLSLSAAAFPPSPVSLGAFFGGFPSTGLHHVRSPSGSQPSASAAGANGHLGRPSNSQSSSGNSSASTSDQEGPSSPPVRGFVRLDSLEGHCITTPTKSSHTAPVMASSPKHRKGLFHSFIASPQASTSAPKSFHHTQMTPAESKWFGHHASLPATPSPSTPSAGIIFSKVCRQSVSPPSVPHLEKSHSMPAVSSARQNSVSEKLVQQEEPKSSNNRLKEEVLEEQEEEEDASDIDVDDYDGDDDDDWDCVDDYEPGCAPDIPDELLNCGLTCPLTTNKPKISTAIPAAKTSLDFSFSSDDGSVCEETPPQSPGSPGGAAATRVPCGEGHPNSSQQDRLALAARLREANSRWSELYQTPEPPAASRKKAGEPTVVFSPPDQWKLHEEDPAEAADLREARRSDLARRRADRCRMERLMAPVFEAAHRRRMFRLIHGEEL